ncbi:hypothetical protein F5Y16DRAFT_375000 [Xylariaceae sp. FL0255]|nr:hypothetical protein F5Y16DRAFT_375000 [Xylariaceae sp. FL0255]
MAAPASQCRGFSHPFIILVRNTLRSKHASDLPRGSSYLSSNLPRSHRTFATKKANPPTHTNIGKPPPIPVVRKIGKVENGPLHSKNPVALYESAPGRLFAISSYGAGLFCFGAAGINSWFNVFNIPEGIASWVPASFGVITFAFAVLGTVFAMKPALTIRSIHLLPKKDQRSTVLRTLEIITRRNSPIPLPYHKFTVTEGEIALQPLSRAARQPPRLTPSEKYQQDLKQQEKNRAARQYELDHIMTAPFRDAKKASATIFGSIRRGLTGEGFIPVYIRGTRYKLDIDQGYALEDGRILERFARIETDPRLAEFSSKSTFEQKKK